MRALLLLVLVFAGCRVEERPAPTPDPTPDVSVDGLTDAEADALAAGVRGGDVVTAESPDDAAPVASGETYALRRIVLGDRACYLDVQADGAETVTRLADFGVCSQTEVEDLVGSRVRLEVGTATVMAESCQGDPECPDTESVELVTRLFAAE